MLVDTDVIIDAFDGKPSAGRVLAEISDRFLSVITYIELIRGARNRAETVQVRQFLTRQAFFLLPLSESIGDRAATYIDEHALGSGLGMADALIAATAVEHGLAVCTGNYKHYRVIPGLSLRVFHP